MLWFYTLRTLSDGQEWSGRYPGDQTAVWDLSTTAGIRARLATSEEPPGEYVLQRFQDDGVRQGRLIAEANVVTILV
jgi:hypothetical protein